MTDLLLFHAHLLAHDAKENEIMRPFAPLGLQYLMAWLSRETAYTVTWHDPTFDSDVAAFEARVRRERPRVVGLYGHTVTRPVALRMVRFCRELGCRVIAGGPDPVQYPDAYLDAGVEVLVVGEGERTLTELMHHLAAREWAFDLGALREVQGLIFRDQDERVHTEARPLLRPLDDLPWPQRQRDDMQAYLQAWRARHGRTALSISTSRGCPFACTWCSKQVYGDTFRRRPVDDVVAEVLHLQATYQPDELWFVDDVFTLNRRWVERFCEAMVERQAVMPFYLVARPETVDGPLLDALKSAGCYRIYFSTESGAQHVLDAMKKRTPLQAIYRAARLCRERGIEVGTFVMLGYPGERLEDIRATRSMLAELRPEVSLISVAHPMKGTAFYDEVADQLREPPGGVEANGGRLGFEMPYDDALYAHATSDLLSTAALSTRRWRGGWGEETVRLAVRAGLNRARFEWAALRAGGR